VLDRRFNGPPESANGGYTCGRLAALMEQGPAEVTLRRPPPLGTKLEVRIGDGGAALHDAQGVVAEGRPVEGDPPTVPLPLDVEHAAEVATPTPEEHHPFPTCFVCGPKRREGDGLRIFPGPAGEVFGAAWTPAADLAGPDGTVHDEFVWAALDCPTASPVANPEGNPPIVLGRLAGWLVQSCRAGEPHAIVSWALGTNGRKRVAGSAIHTAEGELVACARATWIELRG
jgi:hypothetical protein